MLLVLAIFVSVVMGGSMLLYWLFAPSYYNYKKTKLIQSAYEDLKEVDLKMMEDTDESMLKQYEEEGLLFIIGDGSFHTLYTTLPSFDNTRESHQAYRNIYLHRDEFSYEPEVISRDTKNPTAIRLQGMVEQDGEVYYISIREKKYSSTWLFAYPEKLLLAVFLLSMILGIPVVYFSTARMPLLPGWKDRSGTERQARKLPDKGALGRETGICRELEDIRREVVADVSHELKTPLSIISSQVEMLQCMDDQIDRDYYYNSIVEEISKMSDMVGNLMDLSLLDHQIQEMDRQEIDLADIMEYIRLKYQALFSQNHIKGEFSIEPECRVLGNAHYLEQAIDNYMMNAFSHTAQGNHIRVHLYKQGGWCRVTVYNQGPEIRREDMEQIWQGYVMKRTETNRGYQESPSGQQRHMGIGLYLVRRIIRLHGGECGAENQDGGMEFWFKLPCLGQKEGRPG